ncbi:aminotransferase [Neobacillus niacini]|uniref:aminotransferase n=1 Tax=Neobacillus driksii TaxID=3035913 RepID=UPI0027850959|nr:aminotransferase [Neobacillus niacini]MDQ0970396.1 aminotransferase [Neobacillus niacini]
MKSYLASRIEQIRPSGIRRFFDLANNMEGIISLGVGEPDFTTPWSICHASIQSIEQGFTSYTEIEGQIELRKEISSYMSNRFKVSYSPTTEIIVTVGGSQALDSSLRAIINPGDEVMIVEPSYVAYKALVSMAGGNPIPIVTSFEDEFKPHPEQIKQAISPRTKAIILCFPNNPTGSLLNQQELEAIAEIIVEHDLLVITDEIYAELTYEKDTFYSIASIKGMRDRTILVSGFSKAFAMTGWRLGFICAPEWLTQPILKVLQHTIISASTITQYGAIEALKNGQEYIVEMRNSYRKRRNFIVKQLNEIGLHCHLPEGAFYVFPSIRQTGQTSEQFAEKLLIRYKVAVVPGNAFGDSGEGYIRCSYATSIEKLQVAMERIKKFVGDVK